ncbi:hypothetical protein BGZ72_001983, partial [Mortierella alpina]
MRAWYHELCKVICIPEDDVGDEPDVVEDAAAIPEPEAGEPVLSASDTESKPLEDPRLRRRAALLHQEAVAAGAPD